MPISFARPGAALVMLGLLSIPALGRADETVLTFERLSQTALHRPAAQGGTQMDTSRAQILVCLGDRRLLVREPDREWVYDFDRRRVHIVDVESSTYADWSLFGLVAFNDLELTNRLGPTPTKTAVGPSIRELEALFSMPVVTRKPGPRETLVDSSRGDQIDVRINGLPFTRATLSDEVLPDGQRFAYERFLLYHCHLHPRARQAIVRSGRLPRSLFYRSIDGNEETMVSLRLVNATTTPDVSDPTRGLVRRNVTDHAYAALGARLQRCEEQCADSARARRDQESVAFESTALRRGRVLDAALARISRAMEACEQPSLATWPAELRAQGTSDSTVRACLEAADSLDPARARAVLRRLESLDPQKLPDMGPVVQVLIGRARLAAGDLRGGTSLMLSGLKEQPCASAAWMDLGIAYYRSYQPVLAWLCFDGARKAAPNTCRRLGTIARLEEDLLHRHPEFFE